MSKSEVSAAGVSAMSLYVPRPRVQLKAWCDWTGNPWDKIEKVVGQSFRVCAPHENVYTMAANAVLRLILQNDIDPERVGVLALGTESSTDNAAGAVIVRGMVDRALEGLGYPRLSRYLEVPELKHACLGGVYALKNAVRYVSCDGADRTAIVVCADVAEYERGSTGEQTQGAGAVAMSVTRHARLFEVDLAHSGAASDYRGPDFRKPFSRHFTEGYAENTQRLSDFPVFSGKYSTFAYLDETVHAVEEMLRRLDVSATDYYDGVHSMFFHRPYEMMPMQAMSFLYVRSLAAGDAKGSELRELCELSGVSPQDVVTEALSAPDLYAAVKTEGPGVGDPYQATSTVASALRKQKTFRTWMSQRMGLGADVVRNLGNLYSAALPAWLAAGFEQAAAQGADLKGKSMAAIGYGSGDAADAIPIRAVDGWQEAAKRIHLERALRGSVDLTKAQYEALHDHGSIEGFEVPVQSEFAITRVGDRYEPAFQDLGIEYYEYVGA